MKVDEEEEVGPHVVIILHVMFKALQRYKRGTCVTLLLLAMAVLQRIGWFCIELDVFEKNFSTVTLRCKTLEQVAQSTYICILVKLMTGLGAHETDTCHVLKGAVLGSKRNRMTRKKYDSEDHRP